MNNELKHAEPLIIVPKKKGEEKTHKGRRGKNPAEIAAGTIKLTGSETEIFWKIIGIIIKNNKVASTEVCAPVKAYSEIFLKKFDNLINSAMQIINAKKIFEINNIRQEEKKRAIISHIIGLGREMYENIINDLAFLEIVIEDNDYGNIYPDIMRRMK